MSSRIQQLVKEVQRSSSKNMLRKQSSSRRSPSLEQMQKSSLLSLCTFLLEAKGRTLSEEDLQKLENCCLTLNPDDIGCSEPPSDLWRRYSKAAGKPLPVIWTEVFEDANFSLTIFRMPKNSLLPLHDHKGMSGINHVIHGKLWYEAFTWVSEKDGICRFEKSGETNNSERCIKTVPDAGNIHMIGALEDTTVFQILCPPYDNWQRPCDYYEVSPLDSEKKLFRAQLAGSVDYYVCDSIQYTGLDFREIYNFVQTEFAHGTFIDRDRVKDIDSWPKSSPFTQGPEDIDIEMETSPPNDSQRAR